MGSNPIMWGSSSHVAQLVEHVKSKKHILLLPIRQAGKAQDSDSCIRAFEPLIGNYMIFMQSSWAKKVDVQKSIISDMHWKMRFVAIIL